MLGEAIAARARRKYRDGLLLGLAMVILFTASTTLLVGWLAVGLLINVP